MPKRRLILLTLATLLHAVAQAQDFTYTTNNGTITITGYIGPGGNVTIPITIEGLPVTAIGPKAFYSCTSLTNVAIPSTVTVVDFNAFYFCINLTNVTIPDSVTSIGDGALSFCYSLPSVTIPISVTNIGIYVFLRCHSLTNITVDARNSFYSSVDGILFNKTQTALLSYPVAKPENHYTMLSSVTAIG